MVALGETARAIAVPLLRGPARHAPLHQAPREVFAGVRVAAVISTFGPVRVVARSDGVGSRSPTMEASAAILKTMAVNSPILQTS